MMCDSQNWIGIEFVSAILIGQFLNDLTYRA